MPFVTVANQDHFAQHAAAKMLRCQGLQQREGLFTGQSSNKTEQVSGSPGRGRAPGVHGVKKRGSLRRGGRGDGELDTAVTAVVLCRCN